MKHTWIMRVLTISVMAVALGAGCGGGSGDEDSSITIPGGYLRFRPDVVSHTQDGDAECPDQVIAEILFTNDGTELFVGTARMPDDLTMFGVWLPSTEIRLEPGESMTLLVRFVCVSHGRARGDIQIDWRDELGELQTSNGPIIVVEVD